MLKKFILIIFLFIFLLPAQSQTTLTGEVTYNVDSARQELLQNPVKKLDSKLVSQNLYDKQHRENLKYFLQGNVELKDRTLAFFSDGSYAVMYHNDKYHVWYYSNDGILTNTEEKNQLEYPYKSYKYSIDGKLINMGLRVSEQETFIYTPSGKLIAHWLGENAYDSNGNIIMKRKYAK